MYNTKLYIMALMHTTHVYPEQEYCEKGNNWKSDICRT